MLPGLKALERMTKHPKIVLPSRPQFSSPKIMIDQEIEESEFKRGSSQERIPIERKISRDDALDNHDRNHNHRSGGNGGTRRNVADDKERVSEFLSPNDRNSSEYYDRGNCDRIGSYDNDELDGHGTYTHQKPPRSNSSSGGRNSTNRGGSSGGGNNGGRSRLSDHYEDEDYQDSDGRYYNNNGSNNSDIIGGAVQVGNRRRSSGNRTTKIIDEHQLRNNIDDDMDGRDIHQQLQHTQGWDTDGRRGVGGVGVGVGVGGGNPSKWNNSHRNDEKIIPSRTGVASTDGHEAIRSDEEELGKTRRGGNVAAGGACNATSGSRSPKRSVNQQGSSFSADKFHKNSRVPTRLRENNSQEDDDDVNPSLIEHDRDTVENRKGSGGGRGGGGRLGGREGSVGVAVGQSSTATSSATVSSSLLPKHDTVSSLKVFVETPIPPDVGLLQCYMIRKNNGIMNKLLPSYGFYLKDTDECIMVAEKLPPDPTERFKTEQYILFIFNESTKKCDMYIRKQYDCIGYLKSNFVGDEFELYRMVPEPPHIHSNTTTTFKDTTETKGGKSSWRQSNSRSVEKQSTTTKQGLGAVRYLQKSAADTGSTRRMGVCIPTVDDRDNIYTWIAEVDGDMLKAMKDDNHHVNLIQLYTKPIAITGTTGGSMVQSVKSFQLFDRDDPNLSMLKFYKTANNMYRVDTQWPLNLVQTFGIVLSSFSYK